MKKLFILILIIPFFSCETNTVEIEKTAGEWYRGSSVSYTHLRAHET